MCGKIALGELFGRQNGEKCFKMTSANVLFSPHPKDVSFAVKEG